jgi:hypothetical protein
MSDAAKARIVGMHQKDLAAAKRLEEANAIRRQAQTEKSDVEGVLKLLKEGSDEEVESALKRMGRDTRKWAENYLAKELQRELMDPKDRELMEAKADRDRLLAKEKAREDAEKSESDKQEKAASDAKLKDAYATKITGVLQGSELPATERTVGKIAYYMEQAIKAGDPVDIEDIRAAVVKDYKSDFGHMFGKATPEQIVGLIGEDKLREIRKWDNERVSGKKKVEEKKGPLGSVRTQFKKKFKTAEQDNLEKYGTIYPNVALED